MTPENRVVRWMLLAVITLVVVDSSSTVTLSAEAVVVDKRHPCDYTITTNPPIPCEEDHIPNAPGIYNPCQDGGCK